MLQWIMDIARTRDFSDEAIARRIMLINFAAIHTSSNVSDPRPWPVRSCH